MLCKYTKLVLLFVTNPGSTQARMLFIHSVSIPARMFLMNPASIQLQYPLLRTRHVETIVQHEHIGK